jgi:hypothetical protein
VVVEYLQHYTKDEGLSPKAIPTDRREKISKILNVLMN